MFDSYSRQARLVPLLIATLPVVLLSAYALSGLTVLERVAVLGLLAVLLPLFDQLSRACGRRCEPTLFSLWGGRPTTQLLRWRGPASASVQHARHQALERVTGTRLPTPAEENADPADADEVYEAAVSTLRTLTANSHAVQVENRHYGFRRNLFGLRPWGISTTVASSAIVALWAGLSSPPVSQLSLLGAMEGLDVALLALWLGVVREPWVREAAWSYADRLIGQVEFLSIQRGPSPEHSSASRPPADSLPKSPHPPFPAPTVAVLTALACEYAAVTAVLRQAHPVFRGSAEDPNLYLAGELPSRDPSTLHHVVATVLPHAGNRSAAAVATDTLRSFPSIRCMIFSGIAGGIPGSRYPGEEVHLGDVLVATDGIVDYDHTWTVDGDERLRRQPQGISADMLRAVQEIRATYPDPSEPLIQELQQVTDPRFARPEQMAGHASGGPRVHFGAIGSAERLLRDAARRDYLASRYGIKGVEMEASGLAMGASLRGVPWFVIRGVADYSDNFKNDTWHGYASLVSAAFIAVLLRHCRPLS